jgi:hypothetical protein
MKEERIARMKQEIEEFETGKQFVEMYAINCMQANLDEGETL